MFWHRLLKNKLKYFFHAKSYLKLCLTDKLHFSDWKIGYVWNETAKISLCIKIPVKADSALSTHPNQAHIEIVFANILKVFKYYSNNSINTYGNRKNHELEFFSENS